MWIFRGEGDNNVDFQGLSNLREIMTPTHQSPGFSVKFTLLLVFSVEFTSLADDGCH